MLMPTGRPMPHTFCCLGLDALKGHHNEAQGWTRLLRPTLGKNHFADNSERVESEFNPFRVEICTHHYPGLSGTIRRSTLGC